MAATASVNTQRGCAGRKVTAVPTHPLLPGPVTCSALSLGHRVSSVAAQPAGGFSPRQGKASRAAPTRPPASALEPALPPARPPPPGLPPRAPGGLLCGGPLDESRGPHAAWPSDSWHNCNLSGWFSKLSVGACCVPVSVLSAGTRCGPDMGWGWGAGGEVDAFLGGQDAGGGDSWPMGGWGECSRRPAPDPGSWVLSWLSGTVSSRQREQSLQRSWGWRK